MTKSTKTHIFTLPLLATVALLSSCTGGLMSGLFSDWDSRYGGADKAYDTALLEQRDALASQFQELEFVDGETGRTMTYNLYAPEQLDSTKKYPLVLFMADASTVGTGPEGPLKQGWGGIIWATEESQAMNPSYVLVPSFDGPQSAVNDAWKTSEEVDIALRLLHTVIAEHHVDEDRVYTTGQSMGGMISFYLNANHPDLFAASIFVGSQWDVNVLEPLAEMDFFYIVSAGDEKASGGMRELGVMLRSKGVEYGDVEFSARLSDAERDNHIKELLEEGHGINFVRFTKGTVPPAGFSGGGSEHMYSFDYAYQLEPVRRWLFQQSR